jgi:hypothetical protein
MECRVQGLDAIATSKSFGLAKLLYTMDVRATYFTILPELSGCMT